MYRITSFSKQGHSGKWIVAPGDNHAPDRLDNPNLFFPTKVAATKKCRELNS